jgi:hypothetical protein
MCPACIGSAAFIAGSVVSTGGLTAVALRKFLTKFTWGKFHTRIDAKEKQHG